MVIIIIKTRLFIVTLFLLVLISMAGVSAADDANDIVANGENVEVIASDSSLHEDLSADVTLQNEVSGSSDDEGLPVLNDDDDDNGPATNYTLVGSFSDLAKAINNSDGKLVLDKDYVFNPETDGEYAAEGISIERHNFIIDGQNHTLDGIGKSSFINFHYYENLTLQNIRFVNGVSYGDFAKTFFIAPVSLISVSSVINCTFLNNTGPGGALMVLHQIYVENCDFLYNTGTQLGGGLTEAVGTMPIVVNSRFIGNHGNIGGAIHSSFRIIAIYCTFENNTADDIGGAVYTQTNGFVNTSLFINNKEPYGGAIFNNGDLVLNNSYFYFNNAIDTSCNIYNNGSVELKGNTPLNLTPCDFATLQNAIYNCEDNVLNLTNDYYCTEEDMALFESGVTIGKKNFMIDGKGHMIYAANRSRIFDVVAQGVTFKDIIFVGGFSEGDGGAIHFGRDGTVDNCTFLDNHALNGGAVAFDFAGTITSSAFVNNTAKGKGGAVYIKKSGNIIGSVFANNIADLGGAAYIAGTADVQMANFTINQANEGGALYLEKGGDINYSQFMINIAKEYGGAISTSGDLNIKISEFETNIAPDASLNVKLRNGARLSVQDVTPNVLIPLSFADLNQDISSVGDVLTLTEDYIFNPDCDDMAGITISKDNFVLDGNGHILYGSNKTRLFTIEGENVNLKNLIIVNFHADGNNGVDIVKFLKNGTVENCTFLNNTGSETVLAFAGGEILNSTFANNTAQNGGAVDMNSGTMKGCIFTENRAEIAGAVYMNNYGEIWGSNFVNNYASENGGAIYTHMDALIHNCNFLSNYGRQGGVIYANNHVTVESSNFLSNDAVLYGVIAAFEDADIIDSNFLFNHANHEGALYLVRGTIKNSNFTSNIGMNGGAVQFYWNGIVENSTFNLNENYNTPGGALYFFVNGTVRDSTFNLNKGGEGGAVYFGQTGLAYNCTFNMNEASLGSAVYSRSQYVSIVGSTFNNNTAENGTVYFESPGLVNNCTFNINQAEKGAGIFTLADLTVSRTNFNGNMALVGAAAYFAKQGLVLNSNFYYNIGDLASGSVLCFDANGSVENSQFLNDIAGSVVLFNAEGNIDNCSFNNTISVYGPACFESAGVVNNSKFNNNNTGISYSAGVKMNSGKVLNSEFTNNIGNLTSSIFAMDATVENCVFKDNKGALSSAIYALNEAIVRKSIFTGN